MARLGRPRGQARQPQHHWTAAEIDYLRVWRTVYTLPELAERFNRHFGLALSISAIERTCARYGIRAGWNGCFQPGEKPWNAGLKGYLAGGRSSETRFKTGHQPQAWVPLGTRVKEAKEGYWKIKLADSQGPGLSRHGWAFEHRLLWETTHGPQPPGTAIVFIDGDPDHLALDNLACVTRAELARLNQLGWRKLRDPTARRALIAEVRLLQAAHRRARELGLNWGQRRRLIPPRPKIGTRLAAEEVTHAA